MVKYRGIGPGKLPSYEQYHGHSAKLVSKAQFLASIHLMRVEKV